MYRQASGSTGRIDHFILSGDDLTQREAVEKALNRMLVKAVREGEGRRANVSVFFCNHPGLSVLECGCSCAPIKTYPDLQCQHAMTLCVRICVSVCLSLSLSPLVGVEDESSVLFFLKCRGKIKRGKCCIEH